MSTETKSPPDTPEFPNIACRHLGELHDKLFIINHYCKECRCAPFLLDKHRAVPIYTKTHKTVIVHVAFENKLDSIGRRKRYFQTESELD